MQVSICLSKTRNIYSKYFSLSNITFHMLMKDNAAFMMLFVLTVTFALMGLTIGVISFPMQTAVAFLDAPIPPATTSSNSTLSNSTTTTTTNSTS
jgi:hypothetical protein